MATRPLPEASEFRFGPYIDELREFFIASHLPCGSPEDLPGIAHHLSEPGPLTEDLSSLVRSIVLREGGAVPHAQLLDILALAIGGPQTRQSPATNQQALRELLTFVGSAMSRPWNVPPQPPATIVPFPSEVSPNDLEGPPSVGAQVRNSESDGVPDHQSATHASPHGYASAIGAALADRLLVDPAAAPSAPAPRSVHAHPSAGVASLQPGTPSRGNRRIPQLLAVAAAALALTSALVWHNHRTVDVYRIQPLPQTASAGPNPTAAQSSPQESSKLEAAIPAKPAASHAPTGQRQSVSESYARHTAPASSLHSATTHYPDAARGYASNRSAPIIRRPPDLDPDNSIVGEDHPVMPGAHPTRGSQTSRFSVSSGVLAGNLISAPDPSYPTLARIAGIRGEVILQAVVAKDGTVSSTHVLRGNHLLRGAAQSAVRRWRYRPYLVDGQPVDVATIVTVDFHDPI